MLGRKNRSESLTDCVWGNKGSRKHESSLFFNLVYFKRIFKGIVETIFGEGGYSDFNFKYVVFPGRGDENCSY